MAKARTETPMMQQYLALKARVPDALLLFRLGDFYELFLEDAEVAAPILDLVLTTRDRDAPDPVPMCGVPFHALEGYVRKLLDAGLRVAIAEQVEDPQASKGLVRRDIVEVASPGLIANADRLSGAAANYLAAVLTDGERAGLAYVDVSTGELAATELARRELLYAELARVAPREVLARDAEKGLPAALVLRRVPDADFDPARALVRVGRLPDGLHAADAGLAARAAAALWIAVAESQPAALATLQALRHFESHDRVILDPATRRHLELVANLQDGGTRGTLLETLDHTRTPLGRRLLARWLGEPLVDPAAIEHRQDSVAEWLEPDSRRNQLADALRGVGDLERLLTRIALAGAGPRELDALRASLAGVARVHAVAPLSDPLAALRDSVDRALVEDPPAAPRGEPHTGYVRDGVDAELDQIRRDAQEGTLFLEGLELREREATGIARLRVRYNRVFGYSIEVSRAHAARVPAHYRRRQTTSTAERYTTDELERWEGIVLRARERAAAAEARVVAALRAGLLEQAALVRRVADEIARLDVAQSLARVARERDYVRPELERGTGLAIEGGRHPVVERYTPEGFIPNDVALDPERARLLILSGPNMAGKSTLLRQVALIVLLAQIGAFVPARRARIGVVDRIFTRVGASDSLTTGESTFMVEMRETAGILRDATPRSLVLLDEIGRGTSTFDGLSIAWAVAEHLHDAPGLRPRTLFATHYHELADLARTRAGVQNFHFACAEQGGEILFLRRMEPGAASRSYGIEVARRAGLPGAVIKRARQILANLEGSELDERGRPRLAREAAGAAPAQLPLFAPAPDRLRAALDELDPDALTPLEALIELARLKGLAAERA